MHDCVLRYATRKGTFVSMSESPSSSSSSSAAAVIRWLIVRKASEILRASDRKSSILVFSAPSSSRPAPFPRPPCQSQ